MRTPTVAFLVLAALNVFTTQRSVAGSCDCHPEVSNASAITVGNCAKIWSNNECTLKEDGAAGASVNLVNQIQGKLTFKFDLPHTSTPKFSNRQFNEIDLYSAIANLANEQNVDFVASVINLGHDNIGGIVKYWGADYPFTVKSSDARVTVLKKCLYAEQINDKNNFYLNFNDDNLPCTAWSSK
jgi:hypothetical protein